jgi:endonuclease/exonuclease/phosphatase family metal-dependent hydrolase
MLCRIVLALLWLLPVAPAAAAGLKLSTWNLEWLTERPAGDPSLPDDVSPKSQAGLARLAAYARRLDADAVGIEEVDGAAMAGRVFPADAYTVLLTDDAVVQRVGLALRRGIAFTRHPDLVALDVSPPDDPHRLRRGLDVTIGDGPDEIRVLVVHLKSGCWDSPLNDQLRAACPLLAAQMPVIERWIADRQRDGDAFAILGDFNRRMNAGDPFYAALASAAPLTRTTAGRASPCWGGEDFIDHILLGGPARDWLVPGSLRVLVYDEHDPAMQAVISDHCPVSVRLDLP